MKRDEYHKGRPGRKYGIYNTVRKCFQFGIREDTPMLAEARLFQTLGDDARKWRFEPRILPTDGLTAGQSIVDEPHINEPKVVLTYTEEEAALLYDLLYSEMEELMHMNTEDRISEEPIFDQEQRDYLHSAMKFCAEQLKALSRFADIADNAQVVVKTNTKDGENDERRKS